MIYRGNKFYNINLIINNQSFILFKKKIFKEEDSEKVRCTYLQALVYNHEGVARIENGPQRVIICFRFQMF